MRVMVDGPYGGVPSLEAYDHVYLLAGGTGVSLTLPLLADLVEGASKNESIEFVAAVKKRGMLLAPLDFFSRTLKCLPRNCHLD